MRSFWLKVGLAAPKEYENKEAIKQMYEQSCKSGFNYTLEHMLQFAEAYPNRPKFSISWVGFKLKYGFGVWFAVCDLRVSVINLKTIFGIFK